MLGRYIDGLPFSARARVRVATAWCTRGYVDASGARCLLGHAENWARTSKTAQPRCLDPDMTEQRRNAGDDLLNWPPLIGERFDQLTARIGLHAAVRLLRARAAHTRTMTAALRPHEDIIQTTF